MSEMLNAGQSGSLMKSVTEPLHQPVDQVAQRPADQQPRRQPQPGPGRAQQEVDQQRHQGGERQDQHQRPAAGQKAERHPAVADVDEVHAGQELCARPPTAIPLTTACLVNRSTTITAERHRCGAGERHRPLERALRWRRHRTSSPGRLSRRSH